MTIGASNVGSTHEIKIFTTSIFTIIVPGVPGPSVDVSVDVSVRPRSLVRVGRAQAASAKGAPWQR